MADVVSILPRECSTQWSREFTSKHNADYKVRRVDVYSFLLSLINFNPGMDKQLSPK